MHRPPLRRGSRPACFAVVLATGALLLVVVSALGTPAPHAPPATPPANPVAAPPAGSRPSTATLWGHPTAGIPGTRSSGANVGSTAMATPGPAANASPLCDPYLASGPLWNAGVNFSVAYSPANGTAPAPMDFAWTISVYGGGLPPFFPTVVLYGPTATIGSNNFSGNLTLSTPATYEFGVYVRDATCTQESEVLGSLFAWGPLGTHPVSVTVTNRSGAAPLSVAYAAQLSGPLPANWTVEWYGPVTAPNATAWDLNTTYFFPGRYTVGACLSEFPFGQGGGDGTYYACSAPVNVTVTGAAPVNVTYAVSHGPYPVNVSVWINATPGFLVAYPGAYLFASTYLPPYIFANRSTNGTLNFSVAGQGCGPGFSPGWWVFATGNCTISTAVSVYDPASLVDGGMFGGALFPYNLTSTVAPSTQIPTYAATFGPTNGSAPFPFAASLFAAGGHAPYSTWLWAYGHGSGANGTFFPVVAYSRANWNGSWLLTNLTLAQDGYYFVEVLFEDAQGQLGYFSPSLVVVGANITIGAPALTIAATESEPSAVVPGTANVTFYVNITSGQGPFDIVWSFGDGTFGSSLANGSVRHQYSLPGNYTPSVTVRSGSGAVTRSLPTVVVSSGRTTGTPGTTGANGTPPSGRGLGYLDSTPGIALLFAAAAGGTALAGAAWALYRRELRREGEALSKEEPPIDDTSETSPR